MNENYEAADFSVKVKVKNTTRQKLQVNIFTVHIINQRLVTMEHKNLLDISLLKTASDFVFSSLYGNNLINQKLVA